MIKYITLYFKLHLVCKTGITFPISDQHLSLDIITHNITIKCCKKHFPLVPYHLQYQTKRERNKCQPLRQLNT